MSAARHLYLREPRSGLDVRLELLSSKAPQNAEFLWTFLEQPRSVDALHGMYTGPEISFPLDALAASEVWGEGALPLENATVFPAAGDLLLTYLPSRVWGGGERPVFDLGLFYAPGGRTLLPVGLIPGSVCARVAPQDVEAAAAACQRIRRIGAVVVEIGRAEAAV